MCLGLHSPASSYLGRRQYTLRRRLNGALVIYRLVVVGWHPTELFNHQVRLQPTSGSRYCSTIFGWHDLRNLQICALVVITQYSRDILDFHCCNLQVVCQMSPILSFLLHRCDHRSKLLQVAGKIPHSIGKCFYCGQSQPHFCYFTNLFRCLQDMGPTENDLILLHLYCSLILYQGSRQWPLLSDLQ